MGEITSYIDVAQVALYLFWAFFASLVIYLQRESKREGFPQEEDGLLPNAVDRESVGFPPMPASKEYHLEDGTIVTTPAQTGDQRELALSPLHAWPGTPFEPTGNPMVDGVGPASWAERDDVPDMTHEGRPKVMPMRNAETFEIAKGDPDPRGMAVLGADDVSAGEVADLWVDTEEVLIRYLEVELSGSDRKVLLPMTFSRVDPKAKQILVSSITSEQFADVPTSANPEIVTRLEEDKIVGYYGGGKLYAKPSRRDPLL
ncbi:MAG: photosynthetic reaction center subunit H [Pseudomonadota bacterium]